jgi:crotonobetaine/carnitine-CoA ligase
MNRDSSEALAPPPRSFAPNAVARWARDAPDAVAIQDVDGPAYTYRELDDVMRRWAGGLRRLGVQAGTHVATFLPNGEAAHFAMLSLGLIGAIEVPVNPAFTGRILHYILENADAEILVTNAALAARVMALEAALPALRTVVVVDGDAPAHPAWLGVGGVDFLAGAALVLDAPGPAYRDIAALMYTSGTTGPSKGVLVPWAVILSFQNWQPDDTLHPGDGYYPALPLAHNSGRTGLNYALLKGARFVCRERFSGAQFWDDVRRYQCRVASIVGPMTQYLQAQAARPDDSDNPLETVVCGPLIPEIAAFKRRFGVKVMTCYGMTETGIVITTTDDGTPWQSCGKIRSGYPGVELRVVNRHDEPVAPGVVGELAVRAAAPYALNLGYYKMAEKTVEVWRNGWFHTGDAFRQDEDGWFYLVDRMKDAIRRRGENMSSYEVESLVRDYSGVADCAAIAVPAEHGEDEILAVVEVAKPDGFDARAFFAFLAPRMPKFMLPRYVEAMQAMPRNETSQRVKKYELRARGLTPAAVDREKL